jgi:DNA polymerase-3 subunit gamma/tau
VQAAVHPRDACDMALLRVIHAASMPDPSELARLIAGGAAGAPPPRGEAPKPPADEPGLPGLSEARAIPSDFPSLVDSLFKAHGRVADELSDCVGLVRYSPPDIELRRLRPMPADFPDRLNKALRDGTGVSWTVHFSDEPAEPSLREQEQARETEARDAILSAPAVRAVMNAFPDAELTGVETIAYGSANT